VGPRAGMDAVGRRNLCPCREPIPERTARILVPILTELSRVLMLKWICNHSLHHCFVMAPLAVEPKRRCSVLYWFVDRPAGGTMKVPAP
jgi:hypothetical protein